MCIVNIHYLNTLKIYILFSFCKLFIILNNIICKEIKYYYTCGGI